MNAPNLRTADTPSSEADRNISSMSGAIAMPRSNGELVFDAPWQSRAFGMAVGLSRAGTSAGTSSAQSLPRDRTEWPEWPR